MNPVSQLEADTGFQEFVCPFAAVVTGGTEEAFSVSKCSSSVPFIPPAHAWLRAGETEGTQDLRAA